MFPLNVRQLCVQPHGQIPLERHITHDLLPLDGDSLTEGPAIHSVQAFAALLGKRLLHGLVQTENLVLGLLLQVGQSVVNLGLTVIDVFNQISLVLVQTLLELGEDRGTVARTTDASATAGLGNRTLGAKQM